MARYIYKGENLNYVNSGDNAIAAGDVISMVTRIGIAGTDIPAGGLGTVVTEGVFALKKKDAGAIAMGTAVYWTSDGITATASTNVPAGYAAEASAAGATEIEVKLLG